jgi:Uma2 family endonuclease
MEQVMDRIVVQAPPSPPLVEVGASPWPAQGNWTYEDYLRLPDDDNRYEIIEGVLYMVNAPGFDHQYAVSELHLQMGSFVKSRKLGIVLMAPFEVHLSEKSRPVQPDLFFVAAGREPKAGAQFFDGVPDLIVEVLSPNTMRTDRLVKFDAYERARVREYWIVNPDTHTVEIYTLDEHGLYALLGQFGAEDSAYSSILEGFRIAVAGLFSA